MWLLKKNINIDQSSKKLDYNIIESFKVIEKEDISLKL